MLPARALAVLRGCPRGAASRGGLPRRLRTVPTACAAAPPSSAGEPGAAARLAASDAAAAALSAAQRPPADAPLRTGRRNMRDAVDSRHACPCCSNDIRGRTVRDHLGKCAPDVVAYILSQGAWPADPFAALEAAAAGEVASLATLKQLRFREGLDWEAAAARFGRGVTVSRLRGILRRDSLTIPLVQDAEPLEVIFEDAELLAVVKPPDLRVHPVHRFEGGSLLNRAAAHLGGVVPFIVHRLDQDTSGVTLLVKAHALTAGISAQFAAKTVRKEYLAVCLGVPPARRFSVDAPIARHPRHAPARQLAGGEGAKEARTDCTVEALRPAEPGRSAACLVRAAPQTGRTHQIRLHLAAAGVPIIADTFYGPSDDDLAAAALQPPGAPAIIARQALHAAALALAHPESQRPLRFEAALPLDMARAADALGLRPGCADALAALPDFAALDWAQGSTVAIGHKHALE